MKAAALPTIFFSFAMLSIWLSHQVVTKTLPHTTSLTTTRLSDLALTKAKKEVMAPIDYRQALSAAQIEKPAFRLQNANIFVRLVNHRIVLIAVSSNGAESQYVLPTSTKGL